MRSTRSSAWSTASAGRSSTALPPPLADVASLVSAVVIVVGGLYYFRSVEVSFADVI